MTRRAWLAAIVLVAIVGSVLAVQPMTQVAKAQAAPFILNVGVQDEMKTRNMIRVQYFTTDVWTADVMTPVFESTTQTHPETDELLPYVMVGTDLDEDLALDQNEIGVFKNVTGKPNDWIAFFDLRGMKFHDGTQVEKEDILFSYHLEALSPAIGSARFLKDRGGQTGTNYTATRWYNVNPVPLAGWLGGSVSDPVHQVAFRYLQTAPNAQFNRDTLQTGIMPAYWWLGTGVRKQNGAIVATNIHPDWGWAVNPQTLNAVPTAGFTLTRNVNFEGISLTSGTVLKAFDINTASQYDAKDGDVIGAGPFKFGTWQPGVIARVEKNPNYFIPDPSVGQKTIAAGLRVPALDAMVYRLYRNIQAGIFALQAGEVDFADWFVPPEFVGPLLADPNIGIKTSADTGYFYINFNFRRLPFGYTNPAQGSDSPGNDVGKQFRIAVAHAIDKRTIVTSLLQNFGVPGHTVVSPSWTTFYNASAPRHEFNLDTARSILDAAYGPDPAGVCVASGAGCRSLPGKGTGLIEILTPQADYDPIRAAAGTLVAQNLRKVGVNIDAKPTAFGRIVEAVFDEQNFDMWILGWSLSGYVVPSYIESFFHSRNTGLGADNAQGYVNSSLDAIIDSAVGASSETESVRLWKWTQGVVAGDVAEDVLYFRTNIFAFRADRTDASSWRGADIFNYWSWILLAPAPPGKIRSSASVPSAVASGGTANVVVTVRDPDGNRVSGATVSVKVASGLGSVAPASGTTGANGEFTLTFTAPTLTPTDTQVSTFIEVSATHPSFGAAKVISVVVTTFPPGAKFLSLLLETSFGTAVNEGGVTVIDVAVTDETGLPASGAGVLLTPSPTATLNPASFTTDATGRQSVTFQAPQISKDTAYLITVSASRAGAQGSSQVTVSVLDVPAPPPQGIAPEVFLLVGAIVATGVSGGLYVGLRRRRQRKK